ncbi:MAG: restriction endonuclease subunit S [Deltaproteobacteria bacterium]|nr:restriction endonuclease subunit S [Deltaproteobacteria bacterium]
MSSRFSDWKTLKIGDDRICLDIKPGFACGKKDVDRGIPHLRMNNISPDGHADFSLVRRIPKAIADKKKRWLQPGDVLFCNTNSTDLVGKTCLFAGWDEQCTYSNHLTRLRVNPEHVLPQWLTICLRYLWVKRFFAIHCTEFIGQSAFNKDKLKEIEIPVPPLDEQRRIVARIEELTRRAEEARQLRQEAVEGIEKSLASTVDAVFHESLNTDIRRQQTTNRLDLAFSVLPIFRTVRSTGIPFPIAHVMNQRNIVFQTEISFLPEQVPQPAKVTLFTTLLSLFSRLILSEFVLVNVYCLNMFGGISKVPVIGPPFSAASTTGIVPT